MPLFTKKFELKPIPARAGRCNIGCPTVTEEIDNFKNISLNLGNKELRFADGIWIHSTRNADVDDIARLNNEIKSTREENNMCHLKIEVLLDLVAYQLNAIKSKDK